MARSIMLLGLLLALTSCSGPLPSWAPPQRAIILVNERSEEVLASTDDSPDLSIPSHDSRDIVDLTTGSHTVIFKTRTEYISACSVTLSEHEIAWCVCR